ncbi:MAG TPA: hypothetical protein DIW46_10060, partial [Microbacterium sp.]|nr:hypothetical protein [Microbacterium sp.]
EEALKEPLWGHRPALVAEKRAAAYFPSPLDASHAATAVVARSGWLGALKTRFRARARLAEKSWGVPSEGADLLVPAEQVCSPADPFGWDRYRSVTYVRKCAQSNRVTMQGGRKKAKARSCITQKSGLRRC